MILNRVSGSVIGCVGAVIHDSQGRLLLIKRGHEPGAGLWSLPGGRIEPGETDAEALVREMREETGLEVEPGRLIGAVRRPAQDGDVLDIRDYAASVIGGTLTPGDDAADARWVDVTELNSLAITDGLVETLTHWGLCPLNGIDWSYFPINTDARRLFGLLVTRRLFCLMVNGTYPDGLSACGWPLRSASEGAALRRRHGSASRSVGGC
jgi:8-oxo-dGTP diphosphatase